MKPKIAMALFLAATILVSGSSHIFAQTTRFPFGVPTARNSMWQSSVANANLDLRVVKDFSLKAWVLTLISSWTSST